MIKNECIKTNTGGISLRHVLFLILVIFTLLTNTNAYAEFTLIADHPEAQTWYGPDNRGRSIRELHAYQNRIYIGFGADDYPMDNGQYNPLTIRYLDENDQLSEVQGVLESQEMSIMETIVGKLIIPSEDHEGSDYTICDVNGCNTGDFGTGIGSSHVYAAVEYMGDIYMAGSRDNATCEAAIWKSSDQGATWSIDRLMAKTNSYGGCARFTFLSVYNGKLYAQGYQYDYSEQYQLPCNSLLENGDVCNFESIPQVHILDRSVAGNGQSGNGQWITSYTPILNLAQQKPDAQEFAGKLVFIEGLQFKTYDGVRVRGSLTLLDDFVIDGDWLYGLGRDGVIKRTRDLEDWDYVDTSPALCASISILNGAIYIGTRNGQVFKRPARKVCKKCIALLPIIYSMLLEPDDELPLEPIAYADPQ